MRRPFWPSALFVFVTSWHSLGTEPKQHPTKHKQHNVRILKSNLRAKQRVPAYARALLQAWLTTGNVSGMGLTMVPQTKTKLLKTFKVLIYSFHFKVTLASVNEN